MGQRERAKRWQNRRVLGEHEGIVPRRREKTTITDGARLLTIHFVQGKKCAGGKEDYILRNGKGGVV